MVATWRPMPIHKPKEPR